MMKWNVVKLGDIAEFIRNGASIKQDSSGQGLKITRIETISTGDINLDKCGYANIQETEYLNYRLKKGDILISHINSVAHLGKCAIFKDDRNDIIHGMNLLLLRPKNTVYSKYIYYVISSKEFLTQISKITKKSVNQASFTVTNYKELQIPLPPLDEQKRIANILDKVDCIRRKRKQSLKLADEFIKSVFLDMFGDPVTNPKGWEVVKLGSLGTFKNGINFSKADTGTKIKFLGVGDFKHNSSITNMEKLSSVNLLKKPSHDYLLQDGDLVFVRSNGSKDLVGRCVEVFPKNNVVTFSGFCIRYRSDNYTVTSSFINYILCIDSVRKQFFKNGRGCNIQNLNQEMLCKLSIIAPSIQLQQRFITAKENIEQSKEKIQRELNETETLFKALQQEFFE